MIIYMNVLQTLSDPNKDLTPAEIRLGKGQKTKKLTKTENRHEKILLGDLYADKEFLRYIYMHWAKVTRYKCGVSMSKLSSNYSEPSILNKFTTCRSIFHRSAEAEFLKDLSEEGFLFLTQRSEFWRNQKPIYVTMGEKYNKVKRLKKIK